MKARLRYRIETIVVRLKMTGVWENKKKLPFRHWSFENWLCFNYSMESQISNKQKRKNSFLCRFFKDRTPATGKTEAVFNAHVLDSENWYTVFL